MLEPNPDLSPHAHHQTAAEEMPQALHEQFLELRNLLEEHHSDEIEVKYEIGRRIDAITADEHKYGQRRVEKLAQALQVSPDMLYTARRVYAAFEQEEIEMLLKRRNSKDNRITYSHLVALEQVGAQEVRGELIEALFAQGWSVRELQSHVSEALGLDRSTKAKGASPRSALAGLKSMHKAGDKLVETIAACREAVWPRLEQQESDDLVKNSQQLFEELTAVRQLQQELSDELALHSADADYWIERLKKLNPELASPAAEIEPAPTAPPKKKKKKKRLKKKLKPVKRSAQEAIAAAKPLADANREVYAG